MKQKNMNKMFLVLMLWVMGFSIFCSDSKAFNNAPYGPNSETPDKPEVYNPKPPGAEYRAQLRPA